MRYSPTLLVPALSLLATAVGAKSPVYPDCATVSFTTTATAANYRFPLNILDLLSLTISLGDLNITIGGPVTHTSKIVARYCEPEKKIDGRGDKLQILLHSITNNKNFWSGLGEPGQGYQGDAYSWIAYASKQGYPTLSLDRLGNGESDHPDPIFVTQGPYEYALYHELIKQIKSGDGSPLPKKYDDLVLVGNSYGSVIVANILALYPDDVGTAIMTGYTYDALASFPGIIAVTPAPAALAIPSRFAGLALGYLTTTSESGRRGSFYGVEPYVDFDFNITVLDNNVRDVVSVGQFLSNYLDGTVSAPKFKGRALVLTGEEDNAFCGFGNTLIEPPRHCRARIPDTGKSFPNAADYSYYSVDKTGHSGPLHYSRNVTFSVAHDFIGGAKFAKAFGE